MTVIDEQGRPEPPLAGTELETLVGFLDFQRATLRWKCDGLDEAGLRATTAKTSMTLGGLLKHMALVEGIWFGEALHGLPRDAPFDVVDWSASPDWELDSALADSPAELFALWDAAVARARERLAAALERGGLEQLSHPRRRDPSQKSLRWILTHMIEEYARHNGHADLLRESVDGATGE